MANHTTGSQRYNARMDKIWAAYETGERKKTTCKHENIKPNSNLVHPYTMQCPDCYLVK